MTGFAKGSGLSVGDGLSAGDGFFYSAAPSPPPANGFSWVDLGLSRSGNTISTTFNVTSLRPTPSGTTYYVSNSGSNAANGLTAGTPFKTIVFALGKADLGTMVLDETSGIFYGANGWRGTNPTNVGAGGAILVTTRFGGKAKIYNSRNTTPQTWTLTSGAIYQSSSPTFTSASTCGIDLAILDTYGFPTMYQPVGSLGAMTAGSCYLDTVGHIVYAWAADSRSLIGDTSLVMSDSSNNLNWQPTVNGATLYVENCTFVGGSRACRGLNQTPGVTATAVFNNCDFWGSLNSNLVAFQGGFKVYRQNCTASGGNQDGLNYHADGTGGGFVQAVEINEVVGLNGYDSSGANNASTSHETCRIISLNGNYKTAQNRTIHDINTAGRWMLGCAIGPPTVSAGGATVRAASTVSTFLDTCTVTHDPNLVADLVCDSGGPGGIYYSNMNIAGLTTSGNIRPYVGLPST